MHPIARPELLALREKLTLVAQQLLKDINFEMPLPQLQINNRTFQFMGTEFGGVHLEGASSSSSSRPPKMSSSRASESTVVSTGLAAAGLAASQDKALLSL